MIKPNFFIVGAAKSGTSSLWQYLTQNPQVYMPKDELFKEPCFFSSFGEAMGITNYLKIFHDAKENHRIIGEASTAYLSDPLSAKRIYDFNLAAKIIILLRNPVDRAYSLYNWMVQDGYEFAESFEEALELEEERAGKTIPNWYEPQYYWNYLYYRSGLYAAQVQRYLDIFGDKVLIIKFDDFKRERDLEYKKICAFLGIEANVFPPIVFNASKKVRSPKLQFVLRKITDNLISLKQKNKAELNSCATNTYKECRARLAAHPGLTTKDRILYWFILRKVQKIVRDNDLFWKSRQRINETY